MIPIFCSTFSLFVVNAERCCAGGRQLHQNQHSEQAEAAIAAAETARTKKIASLRKQVATLEKMKFTVENGHD